LRLALFDVDFSAFLLPRGDERGVLSLFVGVIERPAGLHGLCSGFRSFPFESVFVAKGEFARVEGKLDESDELLSLWDGLGKREGGCTAGVIGGGFEV